MIVLCSPKAPQAVRLVTILQCLPQKRVADFEFSIGLKDVLAEVASIVVIMRLWRVFKIIEESSAEASDRTYNSILSSPDLCQNCVSRDVPRAQARLYSVTIASLLYIEALLTPKSAQKWGYLFKSWRTCMEKINN